MRVRVIWAAAVAAVCGLALAGGVAAAGGGSGTSPSSVVGKTFLRGASPLAPLAVGNWNAGAVYPSTITR